MGSVIEGGVTGGDEAPDLIQRIKEDKRKFEAKYGAWRKEARENYDMVAGDGRQWDKEARAQLEADGKPCVEFDRLGTIVDAVSGSEINNRKETSYLARAPGNVNAQALGEARTFAAKAVRDNCDAEDEESDAFVDVLVTGVGCTNTRMDYEIDEEGQILIERRDVLRMGWDAAASKRNLVDRRSNWEECEYSKEEIEEKWPDKAEDIAYSSESETEGEDELRVVNPATSYKDPEHPGTSSGMVTVTRYQWYEVIQVYKVSGEMGVVEMDEERLQVSIQAAQMQGMPPPKYVKTPRRVYKEAFVCGNTILEEGDLCEGASTPAKDFTYQFITGKRDRNKGYWYGLVRPGKDPQRWANKFFSQILHIINTNAKGGVIAETGAVPNVKKFEADWSKSDAVNWVNPGGLQKIQPKQPAQIPHSLFQTMEFAISSIRDCTGVNLELLGLVDRNQAGVLEQQRTQAGLTILAPFFSNFRLYRKTQGRLLVYFIKEYISDGRWLPMVGPDGPTFVQMLQDPTDVDYFTSVDEAPTARDTKERTWQAIMPILGMMQQQGVMPPPEVLDYLPVPASLAQKMKQAFMAHMQKTQQPNPKQEAMFNAELANLNAKTEKDEAAAAKGYFDAGLAGIQALQVLMGPQQPQQSPQQPGAMSPPPMVQ